MIKQDTITSFTKLRAWQEGHKLVLLIYKITRGFPKDEQFALVPQMRRAVISLTSNIAEGFTRKSYKEKIQFYYMALSSLTEIQNQLIAARDIKYLTKEYFAKCANLSVTVSKILNGLIKKSKEYENRNS